MKIETELSDLLDTTDLNLYLVLSEHELELRQELYQQDIVVADWPLYRDTELDSIQDDGPRLLLLRGQLQELLAISALYEQVSILVFSRLPMELLHAALSGLTVAHYQQDKVIFRWHDPQVLYGVIQSWSEDTFAQCFGEIAAISFQYSGKQRYVHNIGNAATELIRPWRLDNKQLAYYRKTENYRFLLTSNFFEKWVKLEPRLFSLWLRDYQDLTVIVKNMIDVAYTYDLVDETLLERYCLVRLKYQLSDKDCETFKAKSHDHQSWLDLMERGDKELINAVS